ncbi:hypothetical protein GCM10028832_26650 [Streptomyces sparsus]
MAVVDVREVGTGLCVTAHSGDGATCPDRATRSLQVRDRYGRRLAVLAVGGRPVTAALTVRRSRRDAACRPRRTAERAEGPTPRCGRRGSGRPHLEATGSGAGRYPAGG